MGTDPKREKAETARSLLALVAQLGNVAEACRRLGLDRSAYYRIRKVTGEDGKGIPAPRRNAVPPDLAREVVGLCLEFPEWGCDRIAHYLTLKGRPLSSPTVQKILVRRGLGRVAQRMAARRRGDAVEGNPGVA